jgi:hypothetical protein
MILLIIMMNVILTVMTMIMKVTAVLLINISVTMIRVKNL